jgi:hypothetical protein
MGGACILAAVLLALFTRETVGKFKSRDRASRLPESCNRRQQILWPEHACSIADGHRFARKIILKSHRIIRS